MVYFCPKCSNLLRKKLMNGIYYLICKCGYKEKFVQNKEQIINDIHKKEKELKSKLIVVSDNEKILIHPKTSKICPKCGYTEAVYWQEQLFSADEPMVTFFRCLKCNGVWREY